MISNTFPGQWLAGGALSMVLRESSLSKQRVDTLSIQASTGLVAQTYGGLGGAAQVPLDLSPQIARVQAYTQNIGTSTTQLSATSSVLDQLQQIAETFLTGTDSMASQTSGEVDTLATQATTALNQVQTLLNTQIGGKYIMAGNDTANAPVPAASFNAFVQSIETPVASLATNGGLATAAATLAAATATSPFSSTIGTAPASVQVGFSQSVTVGIVAGHNAFATSTGTSTTGSYVRDLVRSLATVAAMKSSQTALGQSFTDLVNDTRTSLQGVVSTISNETAGIGVQQQILTQSQADLTATQTALTAQVSNVQDVDAAATATALTQAQTQLQISYKIISSMQSMSLVQYL